MPIDYSVWKKIDVSDDEDDTHKNIDTPSLFRWRHQSRLEKMAEGKREREELKRKKEKVLRDLTSTKEQLEGVIVLDSNEKCHELTVKLQELEKEEREMLEKEKQLEKVDKMRPWNVDTIGKTGFSSTRINKTPSRALPSTSSSTIHDDEWKKKLEQFYVANKTLIRKFGSLSTMEESERFLLEHPDVVCDDTATCLATECLNLEMEDQHEMMQRIAVQATLLNYLLELATRMKCPSNNLQLISTTMARMKKAQDAKLEAYEGFQKDIQGYVDCVVEQLKEKKAEKKRKEQEEEERQRKEEEEARQKRLGPGGLDPIEVMKSLPEEMRRAFQEKDLDTLTRLATEMPEEEFTTHFQRCIDSGLWVPGGSTDANEQKNEDGQSSVALSYAEDVQMPDGNEDKEAEEPMKMQ